MNIKTEKKSLLIIDGFRAFKTYQIFKQEGYNFNIEALISKIHRVIYNMTGEFYVNKIGFKAAFIGLPEKINPEMQEFLNILQEAGIMVSTTPIVHRKEKEVDSREQEYIKNMASQTDLILWMTADGDFVNTVKDMKNNYNLDTILICAELPEKDLKCSARLKEACREVIYLNKLTNDRTIFPMQNEKNSNSCLMNEMLKSSGSDISQNNESMMNSLEKMTSNRKKIVVHLPTSKICPKPFLEIVCQAIKDTIRYKESKVHKKISWISLESLLTNLAAQGIITDEKRMKFFLKAHKDVFYVSNYITITNEVLTTISLIPKNEVRTHSSEYNTQNDYEYAV